MTTDELLENINKVVHEFDFNYITYHTLMGEISECIKEYEENRYKSELIGNHVERELWAYQREVIKKLFRKSLDGEV